MNILEARLFYLVNMREMKNLLFCTPIVKLYIFLLGYKQHLHYASLRAIECRRAIARSANTGISAFIDSRGTIRNATQWDEEVVIKDTLVTNQYQTLYVRFGDYIGRLSAFIAVMFLCFAFAKRN